MIRLGVTVVGTIVLIVGTVFAVNAFFAPRSSGLPNIGGSTTLKAYTLPTTPSIQQPAIATNWPQFLYNDQGYAANPNETVLSPKNAASLDLINSFDTRTTQPGIDAIVSTIEVIGNTMYFGSWNGNYYAVDLKTHKIIWQKDMGVVHPKAAKGCNPPLAGVSSKADISNGILYVGGANGILYALKADTGEQVWATQVTAIIPAHETFAATDLEDEFLWSSPVIGNGHVYIGVGSYGDCPLIPGHLMMLDQQTGHIQAYHWTEKVNAGGVTIWNRPLLDPADQAVLYATGSLSSGPESDAIVELDWNTLTLKSIWQVPVPDQGENNAFGASCMLLPNLGGYRGIVCHSKATRLYGVMITPNGLVPKWRIELGETDGQAPEYDQADVGETAFDGTYLYVGSTRVTDQKTGTKHLGAAYAIEAATGKVVWTTFFDGVVGDNADKGDGWPMTAPAVANGLVAFGLGKSQYNPAYPNDDYTGTLVVLDTQTGQQLYKHPLSSSVYGAPIIVNGLIYVPTFDGHIYMFGLMNVPSSDVFNHRQLDAHWSWINKKTASARLTGTDLAITASGNALDAQNLLIQGVDPTQDVDLTTTLTFTPKAQYEQAGMVLYQDTNHYIKFDYLKLSENEFRFELTQVDGGKTTASFSPTTFAPGVAYKMELVRLNGVYYAYVSADNGVTWKYISNQPMNSTILPLGAGIFAYGGTETAHFAAFIEMPLQGTAK